MRSRRRHAAPLALVLCASLLAAAGHAEASEPAAGDAPGPAAHACKGACIPFAHRSGMLLPGECTLYLRSNDEFTSFSTIMVGTRRGISPWFQPAFELGGGIGVVLLKLVFHVKIYESPGGLLFVGLRNRAGLKFQDTYLGFRTGAFDLDRDSFYDAPELDIALRFGKQRWFSIYYSFYARFDADLHGGRTYVFLAPFHVGIEFRFIKHPCTSFQIDGGFYIPLNDVPRKAWVNFPNLGNFGFYRRFGGACSP